jgi:hypothetical protein
VRITSDTVAGGIREQLFTVGDVPGVLWTPADGPGPRPLVLIGHGGGQHKKEPGVLSRAFPYVASCGFAVAAIDAPGVGDRPEDPEIMRLVAVIQERMGIRLVAAEPRITAAVLGLIGSDWLTGIAARITIPVEFVLQWDDEGHPRDSVMKLFDALGSAEKTLHANPGAHREVPSFEIDSSIRFFARHLGSPGAASSSS